MKLRNLFTSGLMAIAAMFAGCQPESKLDGTKLEIDPSVVTAGVAEEEVTVNVTADCNWVVSTDAEWIKLSTERGSGNGTVTLYIAANTGAVRDALVHFQKSTTKKVSADLSITQASGLELKPGDGTKESPYLASQAAEVCAALADGATTSGEVYVKGYVKKFATKHSEGIEKYGNALFYITDDPDGQVKPDFYCFQVNYLGNTKFTSVDQIKLGDEVVVYGKLTNYNGTYETVGKGAAYIYSLNGKTEAEGGEVEDPSTVEQITCAQFIEKADPNTTYRLVGKVTSSVNTTYCSFDMNDGTGTVVVWTVNNKADWVSKVKMGGTVTVRGKYFKFEEKGTVKHEMIDAYIEDFVEGEAPDPSDIKTVTVAEFIAAEAGTSQLYRLTGTVGGEINTTRGNFDLTDATGTVLVYGLANISEYKDKPLPGATVTLYGIRVDYNGTPEMKDATVEKMEGGQAVEQKPGEYYPDKDMTWEEATDATYKAGFAGKSNDGVFTAGIYQYNSTSKIVAPTDLVKVYKSSALVVKSTKPFNKLVLTVSESKYAVGMTVLAGGGAVTADATAKTVTWEGEATTELVLQASEGQVRVSKFAFNYTEGGAVVETDPFERFNCMAFTTVSAEDGSAYLYIDIYEYDTVADDFTDLDIYTAVNIKDKFHANGEHTMAVDPEFIGYTDENGSFTAFADGGKIKLTCVQQAATTEEPAYYNAEIDAVLSDGTVIKKSFTNLEVWALDYDKSDVDNDKYYFYCMQDEPATKAFRKFNSSLKMKRTPRHFVR